MRGTVLLLAILVAIPWAAVSALPPRERRDGPGEGAPHLIPPDPAVQRWPPHARQGAPLPPPSPMQTSGTARVLVLLIDFTDVSGNAAHDATYFEGTLNAVGPSARTLRSYYEAVSHGALTVNATIVPMWWHSPHPMRYYGNNSATGVDDATGPIYRLVVDAVKAADPTVNFASFDANGDGVIDHLLVIHAGAGEENTPGNPDLIWSHRWAVLDGDPLTPGSQSLTADGVQVYGYIMTSEDSPIGVVAHEFGHDLGLPDLYDTDGSSLGVGVWDVMGTGSWNGFPAGSSPASLSAWSRSRLGWIVPSIVTTALVATSIQDAESTGTAFRLPIRSDPRGDEYFLVENRQPAGFDDALPGFGLLIWHVDDSIAENDNEAHRRVDLLEADEATTGDHPVDAGDPWHDTATGFGPDTTPGSDAHSGDSTGWRVRDISANGDPMTATIVRTIGRDLAVSEIRVPPHAAVGESIVAHAIVRNEGLVPENVTLTVRVYRDRLNDSLLLLTRVFPQVSLASGTSGDFPVTFVPDQIGRFLIDAIVPLAADEIPSNNERLVHVLANTFAFRDDTESGQGGWTLDGTSTDLHRWRTVDASQENGSAHSAIHAWKFGYASTLIPNPLPPAWHTLTSPSVNLAAGPTHLILYQRYDLWGRTETPLLINITETDRAFVEVRYFRASWGAWSALAMYEARDLTWRGVSFDLTAPASGASAVQVRFNVSSDVMPRSGGWWIDDVMIGSVGLGRAVVLRGPTGPVASTSPPDVPFDVKVFNVGDVDDTFVLNATPPLGWSVLVRVGFEQAPVGGFRIHLAPDRDLALTLAVRIGADVARGQSYPTTVDVTSEADRNATDRITLDVLAVYGPPPLVDPLVQVVILMIATGALVLAAVALVVRARRRGPRPP